MYSGIHNFSEIGKLNKVLLHRPGEELESLTPATLERLLFDDIPYLKVAQEEHDRFAEVLRENGVEVIYYVDEVAKAIADPARQIQLVNDFLNISKIHAKGLRASMTSLLLDMPPKQMVTKMIAGIKRCEVATKQPTSLMDLVDDDYPFVSDPMPNLYFTRDPGACVGEGINIHRMHTPARKRESLLLKYMFLYNRRLGKKLSSPAMEATAMDSLSDSAATAASTRIASAASFAFFFIRYALLPGQRGLSPRRWPFPERP